MLGFSRPVIRDIGMDIALDVGLGCVCQLVLLTKVLLAQPEETVNPYLVCIAFQRCHPHTEIFQLHRILTRQFINQCLIGRRRPACVFMSHGFRGHLGHLIAGNGPFPLERLISIAFQHAIMGQLLHSIISPVILRHI